MRNIESGHFPLIVTGASGRIGRMLRAVWGNRLGGRPILWSARKPAQDIDIAWNIGEEPSPDLPSGAIFLHLAGQTQGDALRLAENCRSAAALCKAACAADARQVFLMSSVAVYRPSPLPISEDVAPDPISDYGRAKREAELAARAEFPGVTLLRLGNLAGADSLLTAARRGPVTLDPIDGMPGGPERSYIGPGVLAATLAALIDRAAAGDSLPETINVAQHPALAMADLLQAAGADWRFGPPRAQAVPRVAVSVERLAALVDLPAASAAGIIADLLTLQGRWPC